ncbi:MAG: hypothetical protein VKO26_01825 [Cyanobacteriota bacterium]|nr:hypothetical protein [Cyanobacteriota bacterium]
MIGDMIANRPLAETPVNDDELLEGIVGGLLVRMAQLLRDGLEPKRAQETLEKGPLPEGDGADLSQRRRPVAPRSR